MAADLTLTSVTIGAPDAGALAAFYGRLLGVPVHADEGDWAQLRTDRLTINVEHEAQWTPPVWPAQAGRQFASTHLDIQVDDLPAAVEWAERCGATQAATQPQPDIRVMLDPAGHPFCLFLS